MGLEHWDPERKKFVLYSSNEDLTRDADRFPFERIPKNIFLDTNIINLLVKYPTEIFEQQLMVSTTSSLIAEDVEALMHIFYVGIRANWNIYASRKTIAEVSRTKNELLREDLLDYAFEIINSNIDDEHRRFADNFGRRIIDTRFVDALPELADRELIGNAVGLGCDVFCTCDRATIINFRDRLTELPLRILIPAEWWSHIKPWAALWC